MLNKLFGFDPATMKVRTEIVAGITTFLAMAYILAVNPGIFSNLQDMDNPAVFTATALAAVIGTLVMAIYAKKPFGLAPGMGLNAFFVFTVCLTMGHTWQFALTAILIEGVIFILLTLTNIRRLIVEAIPLQMRHAIGAGIGLFIAFIGLQNGGIIVNSDATLVVLGDIFHGKGLLTVIGIVITGVLLILKVPGNLLLGIIATAIIGMLPVFSTGDPTTGHAALTSFSGVASLPPSVAPIFCQFQWNEILTLDMFVVVLTFLFIDMFDTMGTVIGVSTKAGMVDEEGNIDGLNKVFMADSIATTAGACLGTSTTTTYVESAAGVGVGGRSGLTAFTTACCFALALFFAPVFLGIPASATAPVLVIVGLMMMSPIKEIDLTDYTESIPAFLTIILMPLAYSISDGILLGVISYVVLNTCCGKFKKLNPTLVILAILFLCRYLFL